MNAAKPQPPVQPGDIIAGKFRVERVLGVGGMGFVIAATHLDLLELRALKFMLPTALPDAEAVERFLREARAASRLRSEHVARVQDVGRQPDGTLFMVMEYLEGTDLGAALRSSGVPPVEEAVIYVLQVLDALAEAHAAGIVHRDLKPANLFLTHRPDGTPCVKVLDFGISKVSGAVGGELDVTKTHTVLGSPQYMSPEQMHSSRDVDARSDIWALGVILYQLLTGQVPFRGRSLTELVAAVMMTPITPPSQIAPQVPPELDAVVLRCLERDVNARYANVGELALGLRPFAVSSAGFLVDRIARTAAGPSPSLLNLAAFVAPESQRGMATPTPTPGSSPFAPPSSPYAPPSSPYVPPSSPYAPPSSPYAPPSSTYAQAATSAAALTPHHAPPALPLPTLSASGAWGGTAASSALGAPNRFRTTLILACAAASAVGAILALSFSRGSAPVTPVLATTSIESMASLVAAVGMGLAAPTIAEVTTVTVAATAAPSAQPSPKTPKKSVPLGDPFGMDRK